jgi:hypothetical protein
VLISIPVITCAVGGLIGVNFPLYGKANRNSYPDPNWSDSDTYYITFPLKFQDKSTFSSPPTTQFHPVPSTLSPSHPPSSIYTFPIPIAFTMVYTRGDAKASFNHILDNVLGQGKWHAIETGIG